MADFNGEIMRTLTSVNSRIKSRGLRARLCDFVWLKVRDKTQPDIAANA
ncbi:DUF7380 domain-containing protein [Pseudomonas syringae]